MGDKDARDTGVYEKGMAVFAIPRGGPKRSKLATRNFLTTRVAKPPINPYYFINNNKIQDY
jgi:hypothetical protein